MVLIDAGNGNGLQFGHTDYNTGEGRFITQSQNNKEKYINPELSVKERSLISHRDMLRRNQYAVTLFCENNVRINANIRYNHATDALSLSWGILGNHGKKVRRIN